METTEYIWMNGEFVKWDEAKVHVLTHTLHYGAGAFEGLRAYETEKGAAIFRLSDHTERLFYSSKAVGMEIPFTPEEINKATVELVRKNDLKHCYIRPLTFFGYGKMGLNPKGCPTEIMIACWPWGAYLPHDMVDLKTSSYIRIHPKSTIADAKIVGHYVNSILAVRELEGTEYHEALFLDLDGNISEGPGENFFLVEGDTIYTPPLGTILAGITRKTVMQMAAELGYKIIEEPINLERVFQAEEAFFTGTAAEVTPIRSIDDRKVGQGEIGPATQEIRDLYLRVVTGKSESHQEWLTYVSP